MCCNNWNCNVLNVTCIYRLNSIEHLSNTKCWLNEIPFNTDCNELTNWLSLVCNVFTLKRCERETQTWNLTVYIWFVIMWRLSVCVFAHWALTHTYIRIHVKRGIVWNWMLKYVWSMLVFIWMMSTTVSSSWLHREVNVNDF